jgi:hypothetical protein
MHIYINAAQIFHWLLSYTCTQESPGNSTKKQAETRWLSPFTVSDEIHGFSISLTESNTCIVMNGKKMKVLKTWDVRAQNFGLKKQTGILGRTIEVREPQREEALSTS